MRARAAALVVSALLLAACGDDDEPRSSTTAPGGPAIALQIRHDDGAGKVTNGRLECGETSRATGDLTGASAAQLCRVARSLTILLVAQPPGRQACTQLYGGPQTARITGTIDGHKVDRRFARSDGCKIKEYEQVKPILPIP